MPAAEPRLVETIALGLLQGPAELLPVSSSAHVGLLPWALRWHHAALPGAARKEVEVALHAGTALALAAAVRGRPRCGLLAAATVPPALAGLAFEHAIEARLGTPVSVAAGLLAGAAAMVVADRTPAAADRAERRRRPGPGSGAGARPDPRRVAQRGRADRRAGARLQPRRRRRALARGRAAGARRRGGAQGRTADRPQAAGRDRAGPGRRRGGGRAVDPGRAADGAGRQRAARRVRPVPRRAGGRDPRRLAPPAIRPSATFVGLSRRAVCHDRPR